MSRIQGDSSIKAGGTKFERSVEATRNEADTSYSRISNRCVSLALGRRKSRHLGSSHNDQRSRSMDSRKEANGSQPITNTIFRHLSDHNTIAGRSLSFLGYVRPRLRHCDSKHPWLMGFGGRCLQHVSCVHKNKTKKTLISSFFRIQPN